MPQQTRLLVSVFVSGAVVMALELLASRLLAPVFGNSIFVWGSLIGVVLASLSVGYYLGGKIADLRPNLATLSLLIFIAGLLVLALPAASPPVFDWIVGLSLGDRYAPLLATTILLAPPSVLLGMVSPYAIRLAARSFEKLGKASGNLYALSTVGSIVGVFLTVFVLIPEFGVNRIFFGLGATLLVVAFLGISIRMKALVLLILVALPFAAPYMISHQVTAATYSLALGETVYEIDTPYHHLVVADACTSGSCVRYLIMDDNFHSAMDLSNPDRTIFTYTDYFHLGFIMNPNITRVLFIGGGGFSGPKAFLRDYPNVVVDVAEIDPEVIRVAETYFAVDATNPRLHIYNEDGRIFLQKTTQKYDLIVLDAYSRTYVPFHLMTQEFIEQTVAHLTPKGIVISNLIAAVSGDRAQLLEAETKTMGTLFPNVYVFAVSGASNPNIQNTIIVASLDAKHLTDADFEDLVNRSVIPRAGVLRNHVRNQAEVDISQAPILTDNYAPVETLLNPITGRPLTEDRQDIAFSQDAMKVAAVIIAIVAAFLILSRKKII